MAGMTDRQDRFDDDSTRMFSPITGILRADYLDATLYTGPGNEPDVILPWRFFELLEIPPTSTPEEVFAKLKTNPPDLSTEEWLELRALFKASGATET